ncbi:hypothetical protein EHS25_006914 [Saitozyma podzolica]|uniref:Uncharacterized protein n=1 Tax=Saitozyma podzolica TaxID=1890683 RepID=A0A427XR63_9TREE|nr:hypothetical protein EHS25_006914 [Saitozyma podzolica]
MSTTAEQLEKILKRIEAEEEAGTGKADRYEAQAMELKKKLKKEEKAGPPVHPAGLTAIRTGHADHHDHGGNQSRGLVSYSSIIWYGYSQAVAESAPQPEDPSKKLRAILSKMYPERPDLWAHTRSHPSAFLTTRHAPPRLFPFPLGKTRPEATVKDELWWEGGNAPHVGHFNKPKLPAPPGPDPSVLFEKVKKKMAIEVQENMWRKRIRSFQTLCFIVIVSYVNRKLAAAGLAYLVYSTIASEIEGMLAPGPDMEEVQDTIEKIVRAAARNESAPKSDLKKREPNSGMTYIFDPTSAGTLIKSADIPIVTVPAPVLMTSQNHWYAGAGEQIK